MVSRIASSILALALVACGASSSNGSPDPGASTTAGPDTPVAHDTPVAREVPPQGGEPAADPPTVRQAEMWEGRTAPDPSWVACAADGDCATVEIGCCDHCNGGALAAVRSERAAEVAAGQRASCGDPACTEMACAAGRAVCSEGQCAYVAMWRGGSAP